MKKFIITAIICAFTAFAGFSQTATIEKNVIQFSGSAELSNGMVQIKYESNPSNKDIYVNLTPVGAYLELYVEKKEAGVITVKCNNSKTGKFDYIITVKRAREIQTQPKTN